MKTVEQYISEWQLKVEGLIAIDASMDWCEEERLKFWSAALLDAYKAGMSEAASIAKKSFYTGGQQFAADNILSARDRKTSL